MLLRTIVVAVCGLVFWGCGPTLARLEARPQQAPASRVELTLPDGFVPSRQFSGFVDEALGTSIVIVELPGTAYEQVISGLEAGALAAKDVRKATPGTLDRASPYVYVRAEQTIGGLSFVKFMLAFRDGDVSALVTANVEQSAVKRGVITPAKIEAILASARMAETAAPAHDLFALGYTGPFRLAGTILGTTRIYTLDGRLEASAKADERSTVVVSPSLDVRAVTNPEAYAEKLLDGLPGLAKTQISSKTRAITGDMDTVEIVGHAKDRDGGNEVAIYQALLLPASGGYFRIVGQMPLGEEERLLAEMRRMTASLKPLL